MVAQGRARRLAKERDGIRAAGYNVMTDEYTSHDYQHEEMTWRIGFPTTELAVEFPAEYPFQPPAVRCTAPFPQTNLFI
eukprot:COSAG05_NODE_7738_length_774_cov_1.200000_1_plen_78_part_01